MKTNKFNHFKMYKSGKQWIIGSVTVGIAIVALGTVDNNILHFESTTVYAAKVQQNDDVKAAPEFILNDTKNFSNIKYIDNNNALGIASLFSIFAQNAKLGADVNGNIAVQNLIDANRDFGTRSNNYNTTTNDVSYIQNINDNKTLNDRAFRAENSVAILGESIKIESNSAGQTEINGGRVSTLTKDNTFQDANSNKYIDFDAYFSSLKLKADTYNASSQTENVISEYSDMNKQFIDVSNVDKNQKFIYVDIDYNKLAGPQDITVKGLSAELLGPTVIFNVKNLPSNDAWIQTKINYEYSNGQTVRQNSENHSMPNHVVWNFGSYQNNINISSGRLLGSVLAPEATVNVGVNVDGNIVGANVNVTGGETHRWDVQTPFTQENEPESTPESVPESVPESTPESVPESTPESVPESTPESVPESTPESVP
ncbi:collagen-binding domain-containing protein, partial [Leuconostoc litchii]